MQSQENIGQFPCDPKPVGPNKVDNYVLMHEQITNTIDEEKISKSNKQHANHSERGAPCPKRKTSQDYCICRTSLLRYSRPHTHMSIRCSPRHSTVSMDHQSGPSFSLLYQESMRSINYLNSHKQAYHRMHRLCSNWDINQYLFQLQDIKKYIIVLYM